MFRPEPKWAQLIAETKRVMVEEIKAFEEKLARDGAALEAAEKAQAAKKQS
jgi:hypothetical protein